MRERSGADTMDRAWPAMLERAAARGEAPPTAAHPRVATTLTMLLRAEYAIRGIPSVPDQVLTEIIDEVFLPSYAAAPVAAELVEDSGTGT